VELVGILRLLSRRPIVVAIGAVAAIAVGIWAAGSGEVESRGNASTRLMLDTAKSQLTHQNPSGADTLTWRSILLAYFAGSRRLTDHIAKEAGVRRNELVVSYPGLEVPAVPAALPSRAAEVAAVTPEKYVLIVDFDGLLPIIRLETLAPNRGAAVRLVEAARDTLKDAGTPARITPEVQGLIVESMGPVRSKAIIDEPRPLLRIAIAIVLFGVWCAVVASISVLLSAWRNAGRRPQAAVLAGRPAEANTTKS
jgi:hypothetical protein